MRPSELHRLLPEATPRVLDLQLKELVEDGLVDKRIYPELPPRSEYAISPLGKTLIPIIDAMIEWGNQNTELFERKYGRKK
jgi:DNA-binding HxlR family transcriptional regulator